MNSRLELILPKRFEDKLSLPDKGIVYSTISRYSEILSDKELIFFPPIH